MPTEPTNLQAIAEARTSRKRQAPLNDNDEPVTVPIPKRRKITAPAATSGTALLKKGVPPKRKPSVEEIPEAPVHSDPPRNPRNILEASDGSDNDFDGPTSSVTAPMQVESDEEDEVEIIEKPKEDDEAELGLLCLLSFLRISSDFAIVHMSKKWTSPVYVFYKNTLRIEYKNNRRSHIFVCAAGHCKGKTRDVCRYLDKGDANSTSNLLCHAKICWGIEAVEAATASVWKSGLVRSFGQIWKDRNRNRSTNFQNLEKTRPNHC